LKRIPRASNIAKKTEAKSEVKTKTELEPSTEDENKWLRNYAE